MEESKETPTKFFELDKMSPMIVYGILSAISLFTIYNTKTNLEKARSTISENVIDIYTWYEVVFIIFGGLMLICFGQNGEKSLSCILLFIPILLIALKLVIIFISINGLYKKIPGDHFGGGIPINNIPINNIPTVSDLNQKLNNDNNNSIQGGGQVMSPPIGDIYSGNMNPPLNQQNQMSMGNAEPMGMSGY